MADERGKISLGQMPGDGEDHAAKILRDKIGDILSLGDKPTAKPVQAGAVAADQKELEQRIIAALQTVYDPEIPLNIYDLGLIYKLVIEPTNAVKVEMTLTAPGCPVAGDIVAEVKRKVESIPEVPKVEVELVWDPPWTRERLSEAARLELGLM
jgi:FeS assembly SUF system protein